MTKKVFYSKKIDNISKLKTSFILLNKNLLKNQKRINSFYTKQKKRKKCKNCNFLLRESYFNSHNVKYTLCARCNHLNGYYEESISFANFLYNNEMGVNYIKSYSKNYNSRVKNIYLPKIDFIRSVIKKKINILDIGSGAGQFLKACEIRKVPAKGFELNKKLVKYARGRLKNNFIDNIKIDQVNNIIEENDESNLLSLINVLEHVNDPNSILKSFINSDLEYIFLSVPLFSLSCFIENSFKDVYPRLLAGAHTHLYTKESLYFLFKKHNLRVIGEWWFGEDFLDLYRSLLVSSNSQKNKYDRYLRKYLFSMLNELQGVLDKNKICSEVHIILSK
jgi:2-polyprenyl-3-methyl-5-hydroxy-6-metoxy-1,4-benzoquinol methylase